MKIIEVKNISMRFNMTNDKVNSLKEYFIKLVSKNLKFKDFWALKNVSFDVEQGEVVGIIGHNGAGKSTILKVISGILSPTSGTVTTRGSIVPMLELGSGFDFDLTGRENIFLNGAILGYSESFLKSKFDEILAFSELGDFIDIPIRNYSSGMLMRLAFSIATVVNPEIMIVDEILSVGDASFQKKSKDRMMEMMSGGTTVLFVSHSISQVEEMCSRVIWLDHGTVKMIGDPTEVCDAYLGKPGAKKEYSALYFDEGAGFYQDSFKASAVHMDGKPFSQVFHLPAPVIRLRYDPTAETPCLLRDLEILADGKPAAFQVLGSNGTKVQNSWYFNGIDSQIEFQLERAAEEIEIRGYMTELGDE